MPAHFGHLQIQQHQIRHVFPDCGQSLLAVAGRGHVAFQRTKPHLQETT